MAGDVCYARDPLDATYSRWRHFVGCKYVHAIWYMPLKICKIVVPHQRDTRSRIIHKFGQSVGDHGVDTVPFAKVAHDLGTVELERRRSKALGAHGYITVWHVIHPSTSRAGGCLYEVGRSGRCPRRMTVCAGTVAPHTHENVSAAFSCKSKRRSDRRNVRVALCDLCLQILSVLFHHGVVSSPFAVDLSLDLNRPALVLMCTFGHGLGNFSRDATEVTSSGCVSCDRRGDRARATL